MANAMKIVLPLLGTFVASRGHLQPDFHAK